MDGVLSRAAPSGPLPRLRDELRLLPADAGRDGSPAWLIQDPVSNRFFRIGWMDFEILVRWQLQTPAEVARSVSEETTLQVDASEVMSLAAFLRQHGLVQRSAAQDVDAMRQRAVAQAKGLGEWLLHHYLFFRLPLVRPQDRLARAMPSLRWIFTPATAAIVAVLTVLGLALAVHQWDTFASSLVDHFTWQGIVGFTLALMFAKFVHELGHAFTATLHGVRVAHMGVAMVVLFPMLYTDTSESWKLASHRQRLAIASAGILAEVALAGVATLLWGLAPDGAFRTAMFFLATTSWVMTLLVNASPFMRFDGYFILCDLLGFPNLHERSAAFARTWLRRAVLGLAQPWPEEAPAHVRGWLVAFALTTWAYRFVVFLGIAVLVYVYCFKALGIVLMLVELGWFIVRPVHAELKEWWGLRAGVPAMPKLRMAAAAAAAVMLLAVPWQAGVHGAGVVRAERQHVVFAPRAGELKSLPRRVHVAEGELLFSLEAPDLRSGAQRAHALAEARAAQLAGLAGLQDGEERRAALQSERARFLAEAGVFRGEHSRMQLVAPFGGILEDVDPQLAPGVWVQPRHPLAILVDPSSWVAEVYVGEQDLARIREGDEARVYCDGRPIDGRVAQLDSSRTSALPYPMLDAASGGPIATVSPPEGRAERLARDGIFRVRIALQAAPARRQMSVCTAVIAGERRSLAHGLLDHVMSVLIRESGF